MDCDLQHPPETLIKMYRLWEDGYQVIEGVKHPEEEKFHSQDVCKNILQYYQ